MANTPADVPGPILFTDASVIPGVVGQRVVIVKLVVTGSAASTFTIADTQGSGETMTINLGAGTGVVLPFDGDGWWQSSDAIATSASVTFTGASANWWVGYYYG